jgi:hypothetical protein
MALYIFLNEHSLVNCACDCNTAHDYIIGLARIVAKVNEISVNGNSAKFLTTRNAKEKIMISCTSYTVSRCLKDLLNNSSKRRDLARLIALLFDHSSFQPGDSASRFIFTHENSDESCNHGACGLGYTYLRGGLSISLPSDDCWKSDSVRLGVSERQWRDGRPANTNPNQ